MTNARAPERRVVFELCAESIEACRAALHGGADRIELCVSLEVDGLTPPDALIRAAVRESNVPVHVLVRPRADNFRYSAAVYAKISRSASRAVELGAAGIVTGLLRTDGTVDVEHMREIVELVMPLPVSFHRAFDVAPDQPRALEDVIASGCVRVLTSGGAPDVLAGAAMLRRLHEQAAGRIVIAAGGGLRLSNARELAEQWNGTNYHGTLGGTTGGVDALVERIRLMKEALSAGESKIQGSLHSATLRSR